MDELTPQARAWLAEARPAFEPSAAQLERLRARRLGVPDLDPESPDEGDGGVGDGTTFSATQASASPFGWGVYVVVAVAVAIAIAVVVAVTRDAAPAPLIELPPEPATFVAAPPIDVAAPTPTTVAPADVSTTGDAPRPATRSRGRREPPRTPTKPPAIEAPVGPPPPEPQPAADDLAAQLELVGGARRAISTGRWAEAREHVATYRDRFPGGAFIDEAEVLGLLADCGDEPDADSRARAERYLERPSPRFAERVRARCLR